MEEMFYFKKFGITCAAAYAAAYTLKSASVDLKHFKAKEFGVWFPFVDDALLRGLDLFRDTLDAQVIVSQAPGAVGRISERYKNSQHFLRGAKVRAVDVMIPDNISLKVAYEVARSLEIFSGIGVYPDWLPAHGLHLDTRTTASAKNPATWAGIKTASGQVYVSLYQGFA